MKQASLKLIAPIMANVVAAALMLAALFNGFNPSASAAPPGDTPTEFGDPLPGLTVEQLEAFLVGEEEFEEEETPETGLGPIFNNVSCVACHSSPAVGGGSAILETRFGRMVNGVFDPMASHGGSLLQDFGIVPQVVDFLPAGANVIAKRQSTPLFGLGLIEAIPDAAIIANARRGGDEDGEVRGRVAMVMDVASGEMRVGRFGWKNQQATLLAFSGDAYLNEMGITSRFFPDENIPNGNPALLAFDLVPDPEDEIDPDEGKADIDTFADFMRFLGPPPRKALTSSANDGKERFKNIGCAKCHTPTMQTGPNVIAALHRKPVNLYSDLLLHDMGSLGDGIEQAAAKIREMRTAPLWGLRASAPYLHDGSAATVDEAIRKHDGQGAKARENYRRLDNKKRQQLLDFLNSI